MNFIKSTILLFRMTVPSRVSILLLVFGILLITLAFSVGRCSKKPIELPARIDSVRVDKPCPKIVQTDDTPVQKPLPAITPLKVSDIVCAWEKWTGVIVDVKWSDNDPNVLKYEVEMYNETTQEWVRDWYYGTELRLGKCN